MNEKGKYFTPKERKVLMMDKIFKELLKGTLMEIGEYYTYRWNNLLYLSGNIL